MRTTDLVLNGLYRELDHSAVASAVTIASAAVSIVYWLVVGYYSCFEGWSRLGWGDVVVYVCWWDDSLNEEALRHHPPPRARCCFNQREKHSDKSRSRGCESRDNPLRETNNNTQRWIDLDSTNNISSHFYIT